ncbi:MAG TPA: cytochrome c [Promineifilum sp.]|nr:cytochrome c [Promineifilum sp.]
MAHLLVCIIGYPRESMIRALYILTCAVLLLAAGCGARSSAIPPSTGPAESPPTPDPQLVEQGESVYARHCAECHGANLEGEADWKLQNPDGSFRAPPHDANGHTWHHSDAQLIDAVRRGGARLSADVGGTSAMPAYGDILTDNEIAAVLDYIKSTWPEDIRLYQWERTSQ